MTTRTNVAGGGEHGAETGAAPVRSVWARAQQAEAPALSRASIVREAIAMLDAEGIEALSMRKLGTRLSAGATSLYRHVATKEELLELALDEVIAEVTVPDSDATTWRAAAVDAAGSFRTMVQRHPWVAALFGQAGLAYLGPNLTRFAERLAGVFATAGFTAPDRAVEPLLGYVLGISLTEAAWLTTVARSGQSEADLVARLRSSAQQAYAGTEHMAATLNTSHNTDPDPVAIRDAKFTDGLDVVLDGLALRLSR
jgi:AcrR family transcriptional regulator